MARQEGTAGSRTLGSIRDAVREAREQAEAAAAKAYEAEQRGDSKAAAEAWAEAEAANDEETHLREEYTAATGRELDGEGNPGDLNIEAQREAGHVRLEGLTTFSGMTKLEMLDVLGVDPNSLDDLTAEDLDAVTDQMLEHEEQVREEGIRETGRRYVEEVLDVDISDLTDAEVAELVKANKEAFDAASTKEHDNMTDEGVEALRNDPDIPKSVRDSWADRAQDLLDKDDKTVVPEPMSGRVIHGRPERPTGIDLTEQLKGFATAQIAKAAARRDSDGSGEKTGDGTGEHTGDGTSENTGDGSGENTVDGSGGSGDGSGESTGDGSDGSGESTGDGSGGGSGGSTGDAGITKAAEGVRAALEGLAKAADEAGKQAVEAGATAAKDATNALDGAAAAAAKAAQDAVDAAAKAAQDAVNQLDTAVREGLDEGGKLAERLREDLDKAIDDVTKGIEGATGRLGKTGDDLLNGLADGVGDFLADTALIGGYEFTFGLNLKADKTPPTLGTTEPPPGDTNKMTPGQPPGGTQDTRSGGDRLRDARGDRISERTDNGPGDGGSGSSNSSTATGGGTSGGGSGTGGTSGGLGGGADVTQLPTVAGTGAGASGGGTAPTGSGTAGSVGTGGGSVSGDLSAGGADLVYQRNDDGSWNDEHGNPIDGELADELEQAFQNNENSGDAAAGGADAAAGAEADAATDIEYSSDGFTAEPTGIDTGTGRMVDEMVQQYRDITGAARAGSEVNPVREGVEVGRMTLDDLPTARDLQQPPPGEDFVDAELVDQRGPDYSSSTGAGVINDPNMTFGPDGPTDDPADMAVGRPEDLGHLADGITGGTTTGAVRSTGPLPSGVDPADLRIGDPVVARATTAPPIEAPSFGTGARGEQYTPAPFDDRNFGGGRSDDQGSAVAPETEPEPEAAGEPPPFEPLPMHALGGPVSGSGSTSTSEPAESTSDLSVSRIGEHVVRGSEGLGESGRIERNAWEKTVDLDDGG